MAKLTAKTKKGRQNRPKPEGRAEAQLVQAIETFGLAEQIVHGLTPKLRAAVAEGKSSDEILKLAQAYASARIASIVALEPDSSKALSAAKEVLDRVQGKSVERKEFSHRLGKLKDEELDAMLLTAIADGDLDKSDFKE